jgi:hypothetical protein
MRIIIDSEDAQSKHIPFKEILLNLANEALDIRNRNWEKDSDECDRLNRKAHRCNRFFKGESTVVLIRNNRL